jgi:hypothetical protein
MIRQVGRGFGKHDCRVTGYLAQAPDSSVTRDPSRLALAAVLTIGIAISAFLYTPLALRPMDVLDFPNFVPLLRVNPTFLTRLKAVMLYYEDQGRLNVIPYAFIVTKWSVFGADMRLWQTARFIQMWLIVASAYLVLRDLRVNRFGAVCGSALFVVAPAAMIGWERLTIAEPLGTLLILLATHVAAGYQADERWRLRAVSIVALLLAIGFTKEMLLVAVPFILAVACTLGADGRFQPIRASLRNRYLVGLASAVVFLAAVVILWVALHAKTEALAGQYGKATLSIEQVLAPLLLFSVPGYSLAYPGLPLLLLFADVVFVIILATGWWLSLSRAADKPEVRRRLGLSLLLLLPGALIYVPWKNLQSSYGLPFLLAPAFLLGYALTALEAHGRWGLRLIRTLTLIGLASCAISAHRYGRQYLALQRVNAGVAERIAAFSAQDSTVFTVTSWSRLTRVGPGPTMGRYVLATTGRPLATPIRDILCGQLDTALRTSSRLLIVSYDFRCGTLPHPDESIRRSFQYLDLTTLELGIDSVRADLLFHPH